MLFTRVASVSLALLSFGLFVSANPVMTPRMKRDASCLSAISTLNSTIYGVGSRFQPIKENTPDNKNFAIGLIGEIVEAIELAGFVSKVIPPVTDENTGSTDNPIADALGEVLQGVGTVLQTMVEIIPDLKSNIADVDTEFTELVTILDLLIEDFISILSVFVSQLANIFQVAGLTQLSQILNLVANETS